GGAAGGGGAAVRAARRPSAAGARRDPPARRAFSAARWREMTSLPAAPGGKRLGLVIDLDICVGCHACAVNCKEWNMGGGAGPLSDLAPYGEEPDGVWFNRVHAFEIGEG